MTEKIEQKIVGYKVKTDEPKPEAPVVAAVERMHEEIKRPDHLFGSTFKVKPPNSDHAMYITINDIVLNEGTEHQERRPYEIFVNSKNMEHFQWVSALTRVISATFRKGGDVKFLVEELKAVFDPQGGYFKKGGVFMPSIVAEIGHVLDTHLRNIGVIQAARDTAVDAYIEMKKEELGVSGAEFPASAVLCTKCSTKAMILMDGCMTCLNCGDSKCQ